MHFSTIVFVAILAAAPAIARNCTPGLKYCGHTLKAIGDYGGQIDQALHDNNQPLANGNDSLFNCVGGSNGVISYLEYCGTGCQDNRNGNNDSCR